MLYLASKSHSFWALFAFSMSLASTAMVITRHPPNTRRRRCHGASEFIPLCILCHTCIYSFPLQFAGKPDILWQWGILCGRYIRHALAEIMDAFIQGPYFASRLITAERGPGFKFPSTLTLHCAWAIFSSFSQLLTLAILAGRNSVSYGLFVSLRHVHISYRTRTWHYTTGFDLRYPQKSLTHAQYILLVTPLLRARLS